MFSFVSADEKIVDPQIVEELHQRAVPEWQRIELEFRSVDVTFQEVYESGLVDKLTTDAPVTFRLAYDADRKLTLLRSQSGESPGQMNHDIANSRYEFEVFTPVMTERGKLMKVHAGENRNDEDRLDGLPTFRGKRFDLLAACRLFGLPLANLLNPNEFETIEANESTDQGQRRIRHSVKYLGEEGPSRREGGIYVLIYDAINRYRLLECHITSPGESSESSESLVISYHDLPDVIVPREIVYNLVVGKEAIRETQTFDMAKPCRIADAEFYLPHYGISESVLETLHPNPWPRWLLIGFGIVTIAIGAWLVRGRRQPAA